jgi:tripartite-type tricarboxylate transporter receptor subunit TctC
MKSLTGRGNAANAARRRWLGAGAALATATLLGGPAARADQAWPQRPIRLVVPFPPGGNSDALGRILAERLRERLATTVVVENRPGGTTQVGTEIVANAPSDGYTLLLGAATAFTVLPNMRRLPYDPANGFEIAGGIADYVAIVTARKELGIGSMAELIEAARREPGKLSFGSAGLASVGHIAGEIIQRSAGIKMLHVPFKGSAELQPALVGGQIDLIIDGVGLGLAKSGRAVPLAAFSARRHPELPEVPSLPEAGVTGELPAGGWGIMAPRGTPKEVMARLSAALEKIVEEPDTRDRLMKASVVAGWTPPADYRQALDESRNYYADLLKEIGMQEGN